MVVLLTRQEGNLPTDSESALVKAARSCKIKIEHKNKESKSVQTKIYIYKFASIFPYQRLFLYFPPCLHSQSETLGLLCKNTLLLNFTPG